MVIKSDSLNVFGIANLHPNQISAHCGYIRSSETSETYFIGLDIRQCYKYDTGLWALLERWVSRQFGTNDEEEIYNIIFNEWDTGLAVNCIFNGQQPTYYLAFAAQCEDKTISDAYDIVQFNQSERELIHDCVDQISSTIFGNVESR